MREISSLFLPFEVKEKADKALEEWDNICKELRITHFLMEGICLGMVRDNGYIEADNDIDVGVLCTYGKFVKLAKKLSEYGFEVGRKLKETQRFHKYGVLIDVRFSFGSHKRFLVQFDKTDYNSRFYSVPHPVEDYLEARYGNWRTPKKELKKITMTTLEKVLFCIVPARVRAQSKIQT